MTIGQKISEVRKAKKITGESLGIMIGVASSTISKIENDVFKGGPDPSTVIKIADALEDRSILTYALMHNPICQRIIPRAFTPLNNINDNPSAILTKLHEELDEAIQAVDILARIFSVKDPENTPVYKETLYAKLEQVIDVSRCVEEMFDRFKAIGVLTEEQHLELHLHQQAKVEAHGHHKEALV
jgi:transcriptional regulator with XRE-family HTH domain